MVFFFLFLHRTAVSAAKLDRQLCGPVDCDPVVEPAELPRRQERYRVQGDVRHVRSVRRVHVQQREFSSLFPVRRSIYLFFSTITVIILY